MLIGEGTAAINQTSAGTAGQPLLSGGASADPNWGTLAPAAGGTGLTTITAHGVMVGEGTSNVATVGPNATSGLALISQGASADPIFGNPTGALLNVQVFTSSGTYTPTAGTNSIVIELVGGGGGGGGAAATGASQSGGGAGGNAGAYVKSRITSGFSGQTVTIGAAGAAGAAGANSGGAGGNSTFLTLTAQGGGGGTAGIAASNTNYYISYNGTASTGSNGTIVNVSGCFGGSGISYGGLTVSGFGGSGPFGLGGGAAVSSTTMAGLAGQGRGSGGSGGANGASQAAAAGGAGTAGYAVIWEYA